MPTYVGYVSMSIEARAIPFPRSYDVEIAGKDDLDEDVFRNGDWFAETGILFVLHRRPGSYIMRYYLPSFAMAVVSWISFVIPPEAIPGRVGLLVTLFLVLTTLFTSLQVSPETTAGRTNMLQMSGVTFMYGGKNTSLILRRKFNVKELDDA